MVLLNATSSMNVSAGFDLATIPGPVVFVLVLIMICGTLFMLFKYFRFICYGLAIIVPVSLVCWVSTIITKETTSGNTIPLYVLVGIFLVIIVSFLLGWGFSKTKLGQKWEKNW